jgi:hypothetical protein
MSSLYLSLAFLAINVVASAVGQEPLVAPGQRDWDALRKVVGKRLFEGVPYAHPCFTEGFNSTACISVQSGYLDEGALIFSRGFDMMLI